MTSTPDPSVTPDQAGDPRRWKALAVLAVVQFMLVLDVTVVNVALPHIRTDLHFSASGLAWVVDGYVLTAGGLLLLGGRLADLVGRRRLFLLGVALFALSSALSGAAPDAGVLVGARFAQGASEALAAPAAFGLVALLFPDPSERAKAVGIFGGIAGLGGTLGPVVSGLILDNLDWRWIFYVNVPVAIVTILAVRHLVDESRASAAARSGRPDILGSTLVTASLGGLVYGLIEAGAHAWGSAQVVGPIVAGGLLMAAFVLREHLAANPLVPLRFFTNRTRVAANVVTLCFASVFFTMFYLLTLFLQDVDRYSPLHVGVAYLPFGVGISIGIGLGAKLIVRVGVRSILVAGFVLGALGIGLLSTLQPHGSYLGGLLPGMAALAVGSGLCFCGFGNASVHQVSAEDASLASGVQNAVQQVGGAVGLALLATLALRHATADVARGVASSVATTSGTVLAFRIGTGVLVAGAVLAAALVERVRVVDAEAIGTLPTPA